MTTEQWLKLPAIEIIKDYTKRNMWNDPVCRQIAVSRYWKEKTGKYTETNEEWNQAINEIMEIVKGINEITEIVKKIEEEQ